MPEAPDAGAPPRRRRRFRIASRRALIRLGVLGVVLLGVFGVAWSVLINMPGRSHTGPLPALTERQIETSERVAADVYELAGVHPKRHTYNAREYAAVADWLVARLEASGYEPEREVFELDDGTRCQNIIVERAGSDPGAGVVVVGAHYDAYVQTPGADDNASGVAGVLEVAARFAGRSPRRTVRFVLFANEEPPHFRTAEMGSHVNAFRARDRGERVHAMISLEMLGYYDTAPGSQRYPPPLSAWYPDTADFIAIVGNMGSTGVVRRAVGRWRETTAFPCYGAALPEGIPGVGFSDHWSFWQAGDRAFMITDTAFFRNANYHTATDTPDTLDYERMARVIDGVEQVVLDLADSE
ncbi:MAG: M28 family peptidase [Phycisphaerales bacterium]